eukprot:6457285-Amphidinium_carterae.2
MLKAAAEHWDKLVCGSGVCSLFHCSAPQLSHSALCGASLQIIWMERENALRFAHFAVFREYLFSSSEGLANVEGLVRNPSLKRL